MSTKIAATIKSVVRSDDETTITLALEKPYDIHTLVDTVFIEISTLHGNKIEFHKPEAPPVVGVTDSVEVETETMPEPESAEVVKKPKRVK